MKSFAAVLLCFTASSTFLLELYARTKAAEAVSQVSFEQAFRRTFADLFARLDDSTTLDSEYFLETPIVVFEDPFRRALATHKGKQSIAFTEDDVGRYAIQDDVLIRTHEGATLSAVVARKKGESKPLPASLFFNIYTDLARHLYEAKVAAIHGEVVRQWQTVPRNRCHRWHTEHVATAAVAASVVRRVLAGHAAVQA